MLLLAVEIEYVHPTRTIAKKSIPTRFATNDTDQVFTRSMIEIRLFKNPMTEYWQSSAHGKVSLS